MGSPIKPTGYPEWASQTTTGITEPTAAKKRAGWGVSERPAAQYLNWLEEKESAWIRYLSYDFIVDDDFIRGVQMENHNTPSGGTPSGFAPNWYANFPMTFLTTKDALEVSSDNMGAGVAYANPNFSGIAHVFNVIPGIAYKDFLVEIIAKKYTQSGDISNNSVQTILGAFPISGFSASGIAAYWQTTGNSGTWWFNFGHSSTPTAFDTGVLAYSPTRMQTFIAEKRGATLTVQIDRQTVGAVSVGTGFMDTQGFGMYVRNQADGFGNGPTVQLDRARFGVRRF